MMESEEVTEVVNMQPTTDFLSGEELVKLRKPEEQAHQLNIGQKFSECNGTEAEKEAIDFVLENQKAVLAQNRGARICDLMQAVWNEELNVSIATKLKGKFVQHMGHKIDDKVALLPEESLFLLENGCIEILNGKAPMSTEEGYSVMLKHKLGVEKYLVYSYLSQLGFIVVPHQKEIKNKSQPKVASAEKSNKKRKLQSPLPEDDRNKRLTFTGAFSEKVDSDVNLKAAEESKSLLDDIATISKSVPSTSAETEQEKPENSESTHPVNEDQLHSNSELISSSPLNNLESSKNDVEIEVVVDESSSVKPSLSASAVELDVDSQSTDVLLESLEKSTGVFVADAEEGTTNIEDTNSQSVDSACAVLNNSSDGDDQNSEVLSCSSYDYNELELSGEENLNIDDEVTLVEITKKETTPLAVIDLLSDEDEEMQIDDRNTQGDSDSDDDIKILEVCNGGTNSNKNTEIPLNLNKIKSQKMLNYKREQSSSHAIQPATPRIQFPEVFRKDLVCAARPFTNLLPLHVQPCKEVYILDFSKVQQNRGGHQSMGASQSQGRLWNSYRDMQDYQRTLRRNRQHHRHQNQPWSRGPRHHEDTSYRRPSYHNDNLGPPRDRRSDRPDHSSPLARLGDTDFRSRNTTRNHLSDNDYRSYNGSEDQKPFVPSRSPSFLGDFPRSDRSDSIPFRIPPFPNPNSLSIRPTAPNFPLGNSSLNPLDLNNSPGSLPSLSSQDFVAEVHRTAYSYATSILSSMFSSTAFNANICSPLAPFPTIRHGGPPFGMPQPITLVDSQNSRSLSSPFANEFYPLPNNRQLHGEFPRNRRNHRTEPYPNWNIQNKKSWNDATNAVLGEKEQSDDDSSDIEEIPINMNEFLWNVSNICPLVKPGICHPLGDVLSPLKLTQLAKLTSKTCRNEKYFSDNQTLEITFDVYKPTAHFKKSCPGTPNLRIIVTRSSDPIPRYSEIAFLQKKWSDGATLLIAVIDNTDISFETFNSICVPDIVPFQD